MVKQKRNHEPTKELNSFLASNQRHNSTEKLIALPRENDEHKQKKTDINNGNKKIWTVVKKKKIKVPRRIQPKTQQHKKINYTVQENRENIKIKIK